MKALLNQKYLPVLLGLLACALPLFFGEYALHIAVMVFLYAYLSTAWNILGGYAGQHSLGHSLFMGIGAYTSTYLFTKMGLSPWFGMWVGALFAGLAGWFVGYLCFRYGLKGPYFALVTIAITEAMVYAVNNTDFLGGAQGMEVAWKGNNFFIMQFQSKAGYYYIILGMTVLAIIFTQWLSKQKFGYQLMAVRENEDAGEALGVDTLGIKIRASIISAVMTALGGTFFAQYFTFINPRNVFGEGPSIQILLFAIIGGLGTVWGPAVGALILVPIAELSRGWLGGSFAGSSLLLYGTVMVLVMLFMPNGIVGLYETLRAKYSKKPESSSAERSQP